MHLSALLLPRRLVGTVALVGGEKTGEAHRTGGELYHWIRRKGGEGASLLTFRPSGPDGAAHATRLYPQPQGHTPLIGKGMQAIES